MSDALWSLSNMCDTPSDALIDFLATDIVLPKIIESLSNPETTIYVPALRCIGNMISSNNSQLIDRCLWLDLFDKLTVLLYQSNSNVLKECLWTFSNITASTSIHVAKFVESNAFDRVVFLTENKYLDLKKEAIWVLTNALTNGDTKV